MSIISKYEPLRDIPNLMDRYKERTHHNYNLRINEALKALCERRGYKYEFYRTILLHDKNNNDLYYYQTDTGTLEPLIALAPMEVKFSDATMELGIVMTYEQKELHTDVFKPASI